MRTIQQFVSDFPSNVRPQNGDDGAFSEWLSFCEIGIEGNTLQFVGTPFLGLRGENESECVEIAVEPGVFAVQCRGARFGSEVRIAAMRAFPRGAEVDRGSKLKELSVDFGSISVLDIDTFLQATASANYGAWLDQIVSGKDASLAKVHEWGRILIPSVEGGFGDGSYGVHSLVRNGSPAGMEIVFIEERGSEAVTTG